MKLLFFLVLSLLLNGCAAVYVTEALTYGQPYEYTPYDMENASALRKDNGDVILCFLGLEKPMKTGFYSTENITILVKNPEPSKSQQSFSSLDENCEELTQNAATYSAVDIFVISLNHDCPDIRDCDNYSRQIRHNGEITSNVSVSIPAAKKPGYRTEITKHDLDEMILQKIETSLLLPDAIYAFEIYKLDNGYKFYDVYYSKGGKLIPLDAPSHTMRSRSDGNRMYAILYPFALVIDVVTFPIQFILAMAALDKIGK